MTTGHPPDVFYFTCGIDFHKKSQAFLLLFFLSEKEGRPSLSTFLLSPPSSFFFALSCKEREERNKKHENCL